MGEKNIASNTRLINVDSSAGVGFVYSELILGSVHIKWHEKITLHFIQFCLI